MRLGDAVAVAKKGGVVAVPVPAQATEAGVEINTITSSELRAGIAVEQT